MKINQLIPTRGETNFAATAGRWNNFQDLELDPVIVGAVRSNLDLRIARPRLRKARGASGDLQPIAHGSGSYACPRQTADQPAAPKPAQGERPIRRIEAKPSAGRRDTSLILYLREIGRIKLLTPQDEIELAARIKNGDWEARDQMIKANLRLVVAMARKYEGMGVPLPDLISEGNIGLVKAVERFDPAKGAKLSTYAACWIKQSLTQALACQSRVTRLPMHVVEKLGQMRRVSAQLREELGREPADDELAAGMETTSTRIRELRIAASCPVSLDAPIAGEESQSYGESIADEKAETPYQKLEKKAVKGMLQRMMGTLDRRERAVLHLRFGLDGEDPKNLQEIGEELAISSERVRQTQNAALHKLRRRIKRLEGAPMGSHYEFWPIVRQPETNAIEPGVRLGSREAATGMLEIVSSNTTDRKESRVCLIS